MEVTELTQLKIKSYSEDSLCGDLENCSTKWDISLDLKEKIKDIPGAMEYIQKLNKIIQRHIKKIEKLRKKLNSSKKELKDASIQTDITNSEESKSIAEDIKEAAEIAVQNSGFVYEETSGMYYDYNTGYYYNAEYGLYYDGTTGTYMKYNSETQSYEFHSQVAIQGAQAETKRDIKKPVQTKRKNKNRHNRQDDKRPCCKEKVADKDIEEGECSDSDRSSSEDTCENSDSSDISKQWPPCMRIIIESSDVAKVKTGSLHIITCDGGTLGREGNHSIIIPDINTSKHHLKFTFNKDASEYNVMDLGSRNGTLLNGKRMSPSKQESEPMKITHGTKIQIGSTVFLCHIHDGSQTCGHCEPGLIQQTNEPEQNKEKTTIISRSERHKSELKNLRKICGVNQYEENSKLADGYTDRAQNRRQTVGSQNPHEKTQVASVDDSISKENKGFKLLAKMGWKEGQSLGKDGDGMLEPIKLVSNKGTSGIGCTTVVEDVAISKDKQNIWKKTQERFQNLPENNTSFEIDSDD